VASFAAVTALVLAPLHKRLCKKPTGLLLHCECLRQLARQEGAIQGTKGRDTVNVEGGTDGVAIAAAAFCWTSPISSRSGPTLVAASTMMGVSFASIFSSCNA
jgi:hypothetical protein